MARHRGLELADVEIHVITAPTLRLDRDPHRQRLFQTTKQLRPRLLLLDPLVRLHGIDENNAGEVAGLLAYFRSLQRELDLSVVLVHHTRKNAAGGVAAGQGLRGSSDLHAFGDSNLYLRRTGQRLVLSSEHRAAPASPPVYLELVATNAETTHLEVIAEVDGQPRRRLQEQVLAVLAPGQRQSAASSAMSSRSRTNAGRGLGVVRASRPHPPHACRLATHRLTPRRAVPVPYIDQGNGTAPLSMLQPPQPQKASKSCRVSTSTNFTCGSRWNRCSACSASDSLADELAINGMDTVPCTTLRLSGYSAAAGRW